MKITLNTLLLLVVVYLLVRLLYERVPVQAGTTTNPNPTTPQTGLSDLSSLTFTLS